MWEYPILGTDVYHAVNAFFIFSFCGWVMEVIVIWLEKKKLTNRGFIAAPFCVIYGVASLGVPLVFRPFSGNYIVLFFAGMLLATLFEYLTAMLMLRLFGSLWWDYTNKPLNYKGILCLESSIGWGVLVVLYFVCIRGWVNQLIDLYPQWLGKIAVLVLLGEVLVDFTIHFVRALRAARQRRESGQAPQTEWMHEECTP